uniref:Phosphoribosylglycinamide synthetase, ATP-grasp (A) domain protein n=1 Tax=uncultured bacterium Contig248 TaxID=1393544 RepID=W0FIB3_9BACT|nr:phosphoribosylglycinamide synthetase, ATP-grasp (A) domain protein [uncultured bacterium Contig248]
MKALVLAGSCPQIVLMNQLKDRGIHTILADNNVNAIARPYADEFVKVDILNFEAVKKVAEEKQVDFLIAVCADQVLLTVAKVSEDLGLPCYIDYATACKVSDKGYMKDIFRQYGIPSSKHAFMSEIDEEKIAEMEYPLVVKPVDAYSSKGVRKCRNEEELRKFFAEAAAISRSGVVIVEEYVEGAELTVDFQVVDGKAVLLSASNTEKVNYEDRFLAFRTRFPAAVSPETLERIKVIGQKIADAFGLKNSPMLVQLLTDDKKESVLEFSARTGGGAKYLLLRRASGFDPITGVIDLTLGKKPSVGEIRSESKYITNEFLYAYPGILDHLEGFEELKKEGVLAEYWQFKWKGAEIFHAISSSDRVASITIQADSFEELVSKHNTAAARIRLVDPEGRDIMRHDLLTPIAPL